jgi:hypothetical protein
MTIGGIRSVSPQGTIFPLVFGRDGGSGTVDDLDVIAMATGAAGAVVEMSALRAIQIDAGFSKTLWSEITIPRNNDLQETTKLKTGESPLRASARREPLDYFRIIGPKLYAKFAQA